MRTFVQRLLLLLLAAAPFAASANADTTATKPKGVWNISSKPALKVDQKFYDNWSSAGNSMISLTSTFFGDYKYSAEKFIWDNVVDLAFGYNWQDLVKDDSQHGIKVFDSRRKSEDKIDITSTFSMRMKRDWNVNASANFKTQFGSGFNYPTLNDEDRILVSRFMAPAYLTTALGFEHKREHWNVSLSFLTGKTTFVYDDTLIAKGYNYGVIQDDDPTSFEHVYFGLGSYIKLFFKKDIAKNLNLYTRLELFYDYRKSDILQWNNLPIPAEDADEYTRYKYEEMKDRNFFQRRAYETDLDFELTLDYRFSTFLSAFFTVNMKYDTDFMGYAGRLNRWQVYQGAGVQVYFNWNKEVKR